MGIPTTFKKVDETSVPAPQKAARQGHGSFSLFADPGPTPSPLAGAALSRIV
ncbi:hypothetical protein [Acutalibacter caecimuris]|uniref:hypothetical protein n=1 Tax=Acutalibacter caecimuris TaxID=3093657 RepID=UPI002AC9E17B|nr:hypothetical protein [Acutalibacter sp. M00118]